MIKIEILPNDSTFPFLTMNVFIKGSNRIVREPTCCSAVWKVERYANEIKGAWFSVFLVFGTSGISLWFLLEENAFIRLVVLGGLSVLFLLMVAMLFPLSRNPGVEQIKFLKSKVRIEFSPPVRLLQGNDQSLADFWSLLPRSRTVEIAYQEILRFEVEADSLLLNRVKQGPLHLVRGDRSELEAMMFECNSLLTSCASE